MLTVCTLALAACEGGTPTPFPTTVPPAFDTGAEVVLVSPTRNQVTLWEIDHNCWVQGTAQTRDEGERAIVEDLCYWAAHETYFYEVSIPGTGVTAWARVEDMIPADQYTPQPAGTP
jgi:hypothetical protein